MLNALESRVTAVVADGLQSRPLLSVVEAPTDISTVGSGAAIVRVSVGEWQISAGFDREQVAFRNKTESRRVVAVRFKLQVEFARAPATTDAAGIVAGRGLLLEDMSLVTFNLAADEIRSGKAFVPADPDPGFDVTSFQLSEGSLPVQFTNGVLTGRLDYDGSAHIWPPGVAGEVGVIASIDSVAASLPLEFAVDHPITSAGDANRVRLRSLTTRRALAVTVASDLPPAQRGAITSGTPGAETAVRIIPVTSPETVVDYQAPTGNLGTTRVEYVAVHIATADLRRGVFLGSIDMALRPGAP